jgi:hypothetical protein
MIPTDQESQILRCVDGIHADHASEDIDENRLLWVTKRLSRRLYKKINTRSRDLESKGQPMGEATNIIRIT